MDDEHDDLTQSERAELAALPREVAPPEALEERVVGALHGRGLIRARRRWPALAATAALFVVSVSGAYLLGTRAAAGEGAGTADATAGVGAPADGAPALAAGTFALLVFDAPQPAPPEQTAAAVAAARAWAAELAEAGTLLWAAKLRDDQGARLALDGGRVVPAADFPPADAREVLGGLFVIRAPDLAAAQRIAAACPLLSYGSTIEVRPFED